MSYKTLHTESYTLEDVLYLELHGASIPIDGVLEDAWGKFHAKFDDQPDGLEAEYFVGDSVIDVNFVFPA